MAGHWLKPAKELVEREAPALAARPVWLFSSGPIGDPPKPEEDPVDVAKIMEATHALEHHVFAGKLERKRLGFGEKAVVLALRAPEGDFRDWDEVRSWASGIANSLLSAAPIRRDAPKTALSCVTHWSRQYQDLSSSKTAERHM